MAEPATAEGPVRRRTSWNLRAIVEDVAGRPIEELQDPDRPRHPYLRDRPVAAVNAGRMTPSAEEDYDPVERITPPLVGAAGRAYHGTEYEHHRETLDRHPPPAGGAPPGPLRRPERLYLHYLLLHMDRLSTTSLRYLETVIREEMDHRGSPRTPTPVTIEPETPVDVPPS